MLAANSLNAVSLPAGWPIDVWLEARVAGQLENLKKSLARRTSCLLLFAYDAAIIFVKSTGSRSVDFLLWNNRVFVAFLVFVISS
jgi:hypothetical protein